MDDGSRAPWIVAIILLLCASFFALAETALASASRNKIKIASDRGDSRAKNALFLMDKFDDAISTLLICTNIVHIAAAAIVTEAVVRAFGMSAVTASTLITTIVVFFFGEMLPKSIAKKNSEKFLLSTATIVKFFMYVFLPVEKFLTFMGQLVAKLMKGDSEISVTEDELYDMIEDMEEQGHINEEQSDLISSALQFGELTVESILTPRVDIAAIDIEDKPEDIYKFIKKQNHSRIPVYKDTTDNIIGILQIRKFLKAYVESKKLPTTKAIKGMLDDVYYTPMTTKIDELLPLLSQNKTNIAVVTDNFGGTLGIVTIEDIVEELVGEIWDEDDIVENAIEELGDNVYLVSADETVEDVFDEIGFEDPEEDERFTNLLVSEWAYEHFTEIPQSGDGFEYHGLQINVSEINHNRIIKVRIIVPETVTEEGGDE